MFHFVPFAGARRKMTHGEFQADLVRQALAGRSFQSRERWLLLPPPSAVISKCRARGKRCVPISSHQRAMLRAANLGRVVVDADAHPTFVVDHIVNAVRNGFAQFFVFEVVHPDFFRFSLGLPFASAVGKISDQFLLFRVHRNGRLASLLKKFELVC